MPQRPHPVRTSDSDSNPITGSGHHFPASENFIDKSTFVRALLLNSSTHSNNFLPETRAAIIGRVRQADLDPIKAAHRNRPDVPLTWLS